jgi:hypothetical protein
MTPWSRVAFVAMAVVVWTVIWAAIGASISLVAGAIDPETIDTGEGPADLARIVGGVGAAAGLVFGVLLTVAESRITIADVPFIRAAFWGAIAGAAVGLAVDVNVANTFAFGLIAGMVHVALARSVRRWLRLQHGITEAGPSDD